ncbi:MAG: aspartate--tRNA ligase [Patescibacteria group bacterium]
MRTLSAEINKKEGEEVEMLGWVQARRDHGKLVFIDIRDRSGIAQVVFGPDVKNGAGLPAQAGDLRLEYLIKMNGLVKKRPAKMFNDKIPTGAYEVQAKTLEILSRAEAMPISVDGDGYDINEEVRMKYRYLDLRRERMRNNLVVRHRVVKYFRDFLSNRGFLEVETPLLTKSTPEGARDYIVPSRMEKGKFYALPQSPQQYKQLLMVAGIEKYFQVARAVRDEDTRGDRQPEHTQLDIEMSFTTPDEVMSVVEEMTVTMMKELFPQKKMKTPWPRVPYNEAMEKYGTDKPDLRKDGSTHSIDSGQAGSPQAKDPDEIAFAWIVDFPNFELDKQTKEIQPVHHMFVQPKEGSVELIDTEPLKMVSTQYDLVCNGYELASGSIRITDPKLQMKIFKLLGMNEEKAKKDFGHLLEAFSYGVPPHGGIAPGIDRLMMILQNEPNIREVIAFPKTGDGRDPMMDAPSEVDEKQLKELGIKVVKD